MAILFFVCEIVYHGYKSEVSGREKCQNRIFRLLHTLRVQLVKNMRDN